MNSSHVYLNRVVWWCRTQVLVLTSLATIILLPAYPTAAQHLSAADRMQVDGASLYMEIRSETPEAPILLWLHGGPGGAERPLFRYFNSDLEKHFVVVYLDQRGAGRSYDSGADTTSLTVAQHLRDLDQVVDRLLHRFRRKSLLLLGHSWGGTLGLLYAREHPSKVTAMVGSRLSRSCAFGNDEVL